MSYLDYSRGLIVAITYRIVINNVYYFKNYTQTTDCQQLHYDS